MRKTESVSAKNNSNVKRQLNTEPYKYAKHVDEESVYVFKLRVCLRVCVYLNLCSHTLMQRTTSSPFAVYCVVCVIVCECMRSCVRLCECVCF